MGSILNTARTMYAENEAATMRKAVGQAARAHFSAAVHPTNIIGKTFGFGSFAHTLARRNIGEPTYEPGGIKNFYKSGVKDKSAESQASRLAKSAARSGRTDVVAVQKLAKIDYNTAATKQAVFEMVDVMKQQTTIQRNAMAFAEENSVESARAAAEGLFSPAGKKSTAEGVLPKGFTRTDLGGGITGVSGNLLTGAIGGLAAGGLMAAAAPLLGTAGIVALGAAVGTGLGYLIDEVFSSKDLAGDTYKYIVDPLGKMMHNIVMSLGDTVASAFTKFDKWMVSQGHGSFAQSTDDMLDTFGMDRRSRLIGNVEDVRARYKNYVENVKKRGGNQKPMSAEDYEIWYQKTWITQELNRQDYKSKDTPYLDRDGNPILTDAEKAKRDRIQLENYNKEHTTSFLGMTFTNPLAPAMGPADYSVHRIYGRGAKANASADAWKKKGGSAPTAAPIAYTQGGLSGLSNVPPDGMRLLDAIAGSESRSGAGLGYNIINGGKTFSDFSEHPYASTNRATGYGLAAGKYQFMPATWNEYKAKLGLKDFSPASQDAAAWALAKDRYAKNTGGASLEVDLKDPSKSMQIARALSGTWTSLPGGKELNRQSSNFTTRLNGGIPVAEASLSDISSSSAALNVPAATAAMQQAAKSATVAQGETSLALSAPAAYGSTAITGMDLMTPGSKQSTADPGLSTFTNEGIDDIIAKILVAMGAISQT